MRIPSLGLFFLPFLAGPLAAQTDVPLTNGAWQSYFGASVAPAGDVDQDGVPDIIVGSPWERTFGPGFGGVRVLSLASGQVIHELPGSQPNGIDQGFGRSVDGGGDLDGDGIPDLIASSERGAYVEVFSGANGSLIRWHPFLNQVIESVAFCGDLDADGAVDYMVGSPLGDPLGLGAEPGFVQVFSGSSGQLIHEFFGASEDRLGAAVDGGADLDGDTVPDLLIGAWAGSAPGFVDVRSGATGGILFTLTGLPGGVFGRSCRFAGDVDGDGRDDIIVGEPLTPNSHGHAWVYSGADGSLLHHFEGWGYRDHFGVTVSGAGDIDGDGLADLLVGSEGGQHDPLISDPPFFRVYSGADGSVLLHFDLEGAYPIYPGDTNGLIGDVDLDGHDDTLAGDPLGDFLGVQPTGVVHVLISDFGGPKLDAPPLSAGSTATFTVTDALPGATIYLGWSTAGFGPTGSVYGPVFLTDPVQLLPPVTAGAGGTATVTAAVPPGTVGVRAWFQAVDLAAGDLSNMVARVVQ